MALAACHQSHNLTGTPLLLQQKAQKALETKNHEIGEGVANHLMVTRANQHQNQGQNQGALEQVLVWKQKSIKHLSAAIANSDTQHKSAAIATIFLLAILEMWETGWGIWYSHVEGAKNFIEDLHKTSSNEPAIDLKGMIASISVYETFGATVLRPGQLSKSLRSRLNSSDGACDLPITGCPSSIMDAIDFVNSQNQVESQRLSQRVEENSFNPASISGLLATLDDIDRFDAERYANDAHSSLAPGHMSMECFVHFCLAWKVAAKLYTTRVIFTITNMETHPLAPSVDKLISHCKVVTRECPGIKCFVWPVFIAGVECDSQTDREWVSSALDQFWELYLGANLKAVSSILKILWGKRDAYRSCQGEHKWNWVRELHLLNVDLALGM
ncbi:fungal-specific transcription factor domain-containing protein [Truncatella angustata]|uniref:Fungal-specific transcription factor domain-containing protein n=1 Tax=Truncatella angustata TaxID=152316 RepID=A0A9P8ZZ93_9PEZI|nr:fungal-specific transcription factor domain-containing protein [Truncatella angustata]KAH6654770.1 fungal-specific transcription factor domain-containing protein [Truncatella angustata]KAH8196209.1 hypothetical protein TruAng_009625 [Truncatella angustata]